MATPVFGESIGDLLLPDRMIENLPGFVYVCADDEHWTMRFLSGGVERILGYSPEDLIDNRVVSFASLVHPDDRARVAVVAEQALAEHRPFEDEYRVITATGETKWVWERSHCVFAASGEVVCIEGYIEDNTAYREASRLAGLNERRYKDAQKKAKVGNWEFGIEQDWWSDELFSILGEHERTCTPSFEAFLERVHADDRERVLDARRRIVANNGGDADLDLRLVTRDGREKIVHCRAEAVFDPAQNRLVFNGSLQDITERARLERDVVTVSERERTRIGHDLHDDLGQELTALSFGLRVLADALDRDGHRLAADARELLDVAQGSILKTRRLARSLAPSAIGNLDLREALSSLVRETGEHSGVACRFVSAIESDSSPVETVTQLYRIAQEAVTNALRHSKAKNIDIFYDEQENTGCLEIRDDGVGISDEGERSEGFGLRSMRYRARVINGVLEIATAAGGGTTVTCVFALPPHAPERTAAPDHE